MAELVASDTNSKLRISFTKASDGAALDLTGATVVLKWRIGSGSLTTSSMTLVVPNTLGQAEYLFTTGQLVAGTMDFEAIVTSAAKDITTREVGHLIVRPRLS